MLLHTTETPKLFRFGHWGKPAPSEYWLIRTYGSCRSPSKKFNRNDAGSLPWQGTTQLAGSGVGRLPMPWDPSPPCQSSWLLRQPTSQHGSWAAEHPGKQSEGWEAKEFGSCQIKRDIRGNPIPKKTVKFLTFHPDPGENIYTGMCVHMYVKKGNIYTCLCVHIHLFQNAVSDEKQIPPGCNELLLSSAIEFLTRQPEAKIRKANFRDPSWLKEMSLHCHCTLLQWNMIQRIELNWQNVAFLVLH